MQSLAKLVCFFYVYHKCFEKKLDYFAKLTSIMRRIHFISPQRNITQTYPKILKDSRKFSRKQNNLKI